MTKKAPDPYPALQPVREALARLYDAVVAPFPFVPESPPLPQSATAARAILDKASSWVLGVCKAYGHKWGGEESATSRGLLGCWEVLDSPNEQRTRSEQFSNRLRAANGNVARDIVRNARLLTTEQLLGDLPDDLVWPGEGDVAWIKELPFNERYLGLLANLGLPMNADPSSALPQNLTAEWWSAVCTSWRELHVETCRFALSFIRWVRSRLDDLDSTRFPRLRLIVNGNKNALKVEAHVTLAGFPKLRKLTYTVGQFVLRLQRKGKAWESPKIKATLKKQLPELWQFVTPAGKQDSELRTLYELGPAEIRERITVERAPR